MGSIYNRKIYQLLIVFILSSTSVFSQECNDENDDKFMYTSICELDSSDWVNRCLEYEEKCNKTGISFCYSNQLRPCKVMQGQEYNNAVKRAKKIDNIDDNIKEPYAGSEWLRLQTAEIAWDEFINWHCVCGVDFANGGFKDQSKCLLEENKRRIKQLQNFYR